jgi:hypothetical protein
LKPEGPFPTSDVHNQIRIKLEKIYAQLPESSICNGIKTLAFITGPLREAYYKLGAEEKQDLDLQINAIFESLAISWNDKNELDELFGPSFFLPQDAESDLETIGTKAMYHNLFPSLAVVASFGIGQGSTQFGPFTATMGMRNPQLELELPQFFQSQLDSTSLILELCKRMTVPWGKTPVIALKSGASLVLDDSLQLRDRLYQSCQHSYTNVEAD